MSRREFGTPDIKIKLYADGARSIIEAAFPELGNYEIQGSKIEPMVRVKNSYDRSSNLILEHGAMELVCTNGLMLFKTHEKRKAKHLPESINKFKLHKRIKDSLDDFSSEHEIWKKYAELKLSKTQIEEVVESLPFSENEKVLLMQMPLLNYENKSLADLDENVTLWNINSAGTQMKHAIKSDVRKADLDTKIAATIMQQYNKFTN